MNEKKYIITYWMIIDDVYTIEKYVAGSESMMIGFLEVIQKADDTELISVVVS